MTVFYTTERTNEAKEKVFAVIYRGEAVIADTKDRQVADKHAQEILRITKGKVILRHWNGDTGADTFLAQKG